MDSGTSSSGIQQRGVDDTAGKIDDQIRISFQLTIDHNYRTRSTVGIG
jgi:hypothetical protein